MDQELMDKPENTDVKKSTGKLLVKTPGKESSLGYLRTVVSDLARQVGFAEDDVSQIEMAVDEACSNVVKHAYAADKEWCWKQRDPEIRMEIRREDGRIVIEVNDHGQRFDFSNYRPTEMQDRIKEMKTGGYGILIMRRFMDEVQYSSNDQTGNTLRLVKYLKKA